MATLKPDGSVMRADGKYWITWDKNGATRLPGERKELKVKPNNAASRCLAAAFLSLWALPTDGAP
jgi:hypothetical protein